MATILSSDVNSQVKKTRDLVFFWIFVVPINSWPNRTVEINFNSNEIVTQGLPSADLWAAVPAPASTKAAIKPPWVIWAALRWFSLIIVLNWYSFSDMVLNKTPPLCYKKPGLRLICSNSLFIIFLEY